MNFNGQFMSLIYDISGVRSREFNLQNQLIVVPTIFCWEANLQDQLLELNSQVVCFVFCILYSAFCISPLSNCLI